MEFSLLVLYNIGFCLLQELKTPKTGSGTDAGETTASSWQFYEDMHEVLGSRPSMDPPVVVSSYVPDDGPVTLVMVKICYYC